MLFWSAGDQGQAEQGNDNAGKNGHMELHWGNYCLVFRSAESGSGRRKGQVACFELWSG